MDFLKKHYEKIILSIVLLIVIFFAIQLPGSINEAQDELRKKHDSIIRQKPKEIPALDLTKNDGALRRLNNPATNKLDGAHNLFNPVIWQRRQDGSIIKMVTGDEGVRDFIVVRIIPIKFKVSYEGPVGLGDSVRYRISVTDENAVRPVDRKPKTRTPGQPPKPGGREEKNDLFRLVELKGAVEDPTEFTIELVKDKQVVTFGKGRPYEQIVAYEADAKYEPEKKNFPGLRQDHKVSFGGETYKVIAITPTTVTIEGESTPKRRTIDLAPAP